MKHWAVARGSVAVSDNGTGTIVGWSFDHPYQNHERARIDCLKKGRKTRRFLISERKAKRLTSDHSHRFYQLKLCSRPKTGWIPIANVSENHGVISEFRMRLKRSKGFFCETTLAAIRRANAGFIGRVCQ
jgi:hypothetical protein